MSNQITQEKFDEALREVVDEDLVGFASIYDRLVMIPGIYEILSEHYNNDAIDKVHEKRGEDTDDD
jgi:hypothetical protein